MKFYNREPEMNYLDKILKQTKHSSQLVIVYGRRRIGKTRLLNEFIKYHNGINFFVEQKDEKLLLVELESEINQLGLDLPPVFKTFDDFFNYLFNYLGKSRESFIFVFDEIQNFNKINSGFFSKFQKYWDKYHNDTHIMLVCIGSIIGMMKKIFLDQKQPLFSRAQHTINLKRFDPFETSKIIIDHGITDGKTILELFGMLDGIPKYLQYLDMYWEGDVHKFINDLFLTDLAPLKEEGKNVLIQEFGSLQSGYFTILECISKGKRIPVEIANKTTIRLNTVNKYLHDLTTYYEIIFRTYPITEDPFKSRNVRYFLKDNFFRFWFNFIYPSQSTMKRVKEEFNRYLGVIFEDVCAEFIRKKGYEKVGKWWNKEIEIDVMGIGTKNILFGECKWSNNPIDIDSYFKLKEKTNTVSLKVKNIQFALFSKTGFTDRLVELSNEEKIKLYDVDDVLLNK